MIPLLADSLVFPAATQSWQATLTAIVLFGVLWLILLVQRSPDMAMLGGVIVLLVTGVLSPAEAFRGMANEGMLTVAALFVVAAAM